MSKKSDLSAAERRRKIAEAEQRTAEHRQKTAEAKKAEVEAHAAVATAERESADSGRKAQRDEQQADAELRKTVAEADAAAVSAYLPDAPQVAPLEGTVTADEKAGVVGEAVALSLIGTALEDSFSSWKPSAEGQPMRVLVVSDQGLATSDWNYHAVGLQIAQLAQQVKLLTGLLDAERPSEVSPSEADRGGDREESVPGGGRNLLSTAAVSSAVALAGAIPAVVGAAADVAGYVQGNYTIAGRDVTVQESQVVAAAIHELAKKSNVTMAIDGFHRIPETKLMEHYGSLIESDAAMTGARLGVEQEVVGPAAAEIERSREALIKLEEDHSAAQNADPVDLDRAAELAREVAAARLKLRRAEVEHGRLTGLAALAGETATEVDSFVTAVTKIPTTGGLPPLGIAAIRELVHDVDPSTGNFTHVLNVGVTAIGSESQAEQRLFRRPRIRYVGACTVSVALAATDGDIEFADARTVIGQLSFRLNGGEVGKIERVSLSS